MSEYKEFIVRVRNADLIAGSPFGTPYFHGEIVRCRDCRYYVFEDRSGIFHDYKHNDSYCRLFVSGGLMEVEPDGFCAWGERRGE